MRVAKCDSARVHATPQAVDVSRHGSRAAVLRGSGQLKRRLAESEAKRFYVGILQLCETLPEGFLAFQVLRDTGLIEALVRSIFDPAD